MATIPTPRSYSQIVGDMTDGFLSRVGLPSLKVGGPPLALIEAVGQSHLRSSQDIFTLLNSNSLDRAEGVALDRIGADEDLSRLTASSSSGTVTISDTRYAKIVSKVYQGQPAPIVGSDKIYVADAQNFPTTGSVYVGRGTTNYEGPLAYTAKTNLGTYWRLDLAVASKTKKFHNQGESVIVAQGGNRPIDAGVVVQTPQGNASDAIRFRTLYRSVIPDGEISVTGVIVIAEKPGISGNVPVGAINDFASKPFTGASVTNPLPFSNGQAVEDDKTYRERIRAARQSRAKGTPLAIKTAVRGITAKDENKRVLSASVVTRRGAPTTVFIDDGTGYEERSVGVAIETLVDHANGGEEYFQVSAARPITKAFVVSTLSAPFALKGGMKLAVKVGGFLHEHTFSTDEFRSIGNASADEVVASINGDATIAFSARTVDNGTRCALFAKDETNEDIEVTNVDADEVDANPFLGFAAGRVDTLRLYKNDRLLSKDGQRAIIESEPQNTWAPMSGPQTLNVVVDDTSEVTHTFTDSDFVNAKTGFATLAAGNILGAWATVFNKKIPGVTATATAGKLTLTSNLGANARAQVKITGGTLVSSARMFVFNTADGLESQGRARDYTLDRNLGQLRLEQVLNEGDRLDIGTPYTRAFIESPEIAATTLTSDAELWFAVDGDAQIIETGIAASTTCTISEHITVPPVAWGKRVRVDGFAAGLLSNVHEGDWAIFLDTNLNAANRGAWRVAYVDSTGFEIERSSFTAQASVVLSGGGIVFVRSNVPLQKVIVPAAANYTAATLADAIDTNLIGGHAETYRTNRLRIRTNSFDPNGDIALVAQNSEAQKIGLQVTDAIPNLTSHLPSVQSGNSEAGTPNFAPTNIDTATDLTTFDVLDASKIGPNSLLKFLRNTPDTDSAAARSRYGTNADFRTGIESISGTTIAARRPAISEWLPADRLYGAAPFALSAVDDLTVVLDGDTDSKRFTANLFRVVKPTTNTYGITNEFSDTDNGGESLAAGFGLDFSWKDFAAYMKARVKSHAEAGDTTKTILWRYHRFGPDGNTARLRYVYPTAPSQAVAVNTETSISGSEGLHRISVRLPSDAPRAGYTLRNTTKVGVMAAASGALQSLTYILGYAIISAVRKVKLNYNTEVSNFVVGDLVTGLTSGATGTVDSLVDNGTDGTLTLIGVTGLYINGEQLQVGGVTKANANGLQVGETALTLDIATPGASDHGFIVGNQIWVQSTDPNFSSGVKTITSVTASTVAYTESTNSVLTTPNVGTVSFDSSGEAKFTGSTVAVNDIMTWNAASGLPVAYEQTMRVTAVGAQHVVGLAESANATGTVPSWQPVGVASAFSAYPLLSASSKASDIAAAVNALASVENSTCPITAVAVGSGGVATGVIDRASFDEFTTPSYSYTLTDGINWIRSNTQPADTNTHYAFTFKSGISAGLASNSDWSNEEIRLVPITAQALADYLGQTAVSGLAASAAIDLSDDFSRVQLGSLLAGSNGSIEVQGGTGNAASASILGSASNLAGAYMLTLARRADTDALTANMWVEIENSVAMPKDAFSSLTACESIDSDGNFVLSGTQAWTYANTAGGQIANFTWQIERHGKFVAFRWNGVGAAPDLSGISEGDWVVIAKNATSISSRNTGQFRVVRVTADTFWIENANAAPETVTADLWFLTYDSIMPGDRLVISTALWGAGNQGAWVVESLDSGDVHGFKVGVGDKAPIAFIGPVALGSQSSLVQCLEGSPTKLVKQIQSLSIDPNDGTLVNVKFKSPNGYKKVGAVAGSTMKALDKLAFPTDLTTGVDGYSHSIGLIGEAAKVLYGDERDPATYPGVVAAGAVVNISGPLVKRIQVALAVRVRSGASTADVIERVKSAVAATINKVGVGQPIAISDLIAAAGKVNGVAAVTWLSPTFSAGKDLINVQPSEKPLVLNLNQDVNVSLVGE